MTREILLHVLDSRFGDPMFLIETTQEERAKQSTYSRTYPLVWDPPPDTMFMRATKLDMGVFAEHMDGGEVHMIDARHTSPGLEAALGPQEDETIAALVALSNGAVSADEVQSALRTGEWPPQDTKARGAILQAAAFARRLLEAIRFGIANECAIVWQCTGRAPTYVYP
ncbi:MAG: hypothetical protein JJ863_07275 [Deltaproteobacteria bacterium]|nr:hypothetical protein [Deltaproteobacteria bacterium]